MAQVLDVEDRLLRAVSVAEDSGCWMWMGRRDKGGYGKFRLADGKESRAHRTSYQLFVGPIPTGLLLRHTCDTPSCVNPDHLVPGTHRENMDDLLERHPAYGRDHCPKDPSHEYRFRAGKRECKTCENARKRNAYRAKMGTLNTPERWYRKDA